MHVLGTGVPRCLGVARSASSPKAAQALGCSLTPGLRISFGRVTCMARAASVPALWTLGFLLLCGVCVWVRVVFGLRFRLPPATPGSGDGVGVCLCARSACTPPLLAQVCGVGVCARAEVSPAPRHSLLGCWGVCVFVCALRLYPATPGWGVWCGCVCLGSSFGCAPPLLAGLLGCVCVFVCPLRLYPATPAWGVLCGCVSLGSGFSSAPPLLAGVLGCVCVLVRPPLVPRHSWLGCAAWVCVLGLGSRLRPATLGWGVGVCVCSCAHSACSPPLRAGVCGACVCVFGLGFRLHPATPGRALGCVCVRVPAPLLPRHSWLGCVAWVCVLWLVFRLRPATPGWGVGVCACPCARSACTLPLPAGVCGVGVCAWAWVSAAPRHSWLGCWGVCVFVCPLSLYPTTPGWGVRRGCVFGLGFRLRSAALGWGVGVFRASVSPHRLYPATPRWGGRCGCVCLGSGFGCAPPLLAGVLGCVCVCVPAPIVPRNSWLGCVVWVCVLGLGFRLRPATPGWGVGVCACSCARSACTLPLLAWVCGVAVCAWARVSAAPLRSWLGCWRVCVFVCPLRL